MKRECTRRCSPLRGRGPRIQTRRDGRRRLQTREAHSPKQRYTAPTSSLRAVFATGCDCEGGRAGSKFTVDLRPCTCNDIKHSHVTRPSEAQQHTEAYMTICTGLGHNTHGCSDFKLAQTSLQTSRTRLRQPGVKQGSHLNPKAPS